MNTYNTNSKFVFRNFLIMRGISIEELANMTRLSQMELTAISTGRTASMFQRKKILKALQKHFNTLYKQEEVFDCCDQDM